MENESIEASRTASDKHGKTKAHPVCLTPTLTLTLIEGFRGVQRGLLFALVRESTKNTFRIGLYEPIVGVLDAERKKDGGTGTVPMQTRLLAGALTGSFAAFVCNPLDLLKTRLQLRAGAHGAGGTAREAFTGMVQSEGLMALWTRGVAPNIVRSAMATGVALPVNSKLKEVANESGIFSNPAIRDLCCALCSSLATTYAINPVDVVRTRLYAQPPPPEPPIYRNTLHCAWRIASTEGLLAFWKGSGAAFLRIGPHQTLTLVFISGLRRLADGKPLFSM